jgi:osmotically-inducible protein OsmY
MKSKTLATLALGAFLLVGADAARAIDNPSDWTTDLNVKLALLDKLGADSLHVDVASTAGAVMLTGTVDKRETMELASTVTKSVAGVTTVDNGIVLESMAANPSAAGAAVGEADAEVRDRVLETKVRLRLISKMGADGFKIGTTAANNVVTLRFGPELNAARRKQAAAIAQDMNEVYKVIAITKK